MLRPSLVPSPKLSLALLAVAAASVAACSPPWTVVKQSGPPSALAGAGQVNVAFDWSKLTIGGMTEGAFVESKKAKEPDYDQTWAKLKGSFEEAVVGGMAQKWPKGAMRAAAPGAPGVTVVVYPTSFTMGHYMVVASTATSISTMMDWTVNGQVAEQIQVIQATPATVFSPSVHQHVPVVGTNIGAIAAKYLEKRQ